MLLRVIALTVTTSLGLSGCSGGGSTPEQRPPGGEPTGPKSRLGPRGGPGQKDPLAAAKRLASSGDTDAAITETEKVIGARPQLEEAYSLLSALFAMTEDAAGSRAALDRGLSALPESASLLHARGMLRLEAEDTDGALADLEAARGHARPASGELLADLAYAYLVAQRHQEAEATARQAAELDPKAYAPAFVLGEALLLGQRPKEAIPAFQRAVAAAPEETSAQRRLAKAHNLAGEHETALQILDRLIAASPEEPMLRAEAAGALVNLGRAKEAVSYLEKAIELAPKERALYVFLEKAQTAAGDKKGAKATKKKLERWKGP